MATMATLTFTDKLMLNTLQRFGQVKRGLISIGYYLTLLLYAENTHTATASFTKARKSCIVVAN